MIESLSFSHCREGRISPVTYKLWQVVSTRSSSLVSIASSLTSMPPSAIAKNFSFRSITSSTYSLFIIYMKWSCMLVIAIFVELYSGC